MSIAEKLTKVAENQQKVYDAGYQKGAKESEGYNVGYNDGQAQFGVPNEVTSTGVVACDYVNENVHNVEVKLSSDTVTDFSGVEVKRIGANLLPYPYYDGTVVENGEAKFVENGDGSITATGFSNNGNTYFYLTGKTIEEALCLPAGTYSFSDKGYIKPLDWSLSKWKEDGTVQWLGNAFQTFTFTEPVKLRICVTIPYAGATGTSINTTLYPMLNVGSYSADYEPPQKTTYTVNADGTVDGVTSISPIMNIICDTESVDITTKYYQCPSVEYDRFWDNYQEFGNRKICNYLFSGNAWNDDTFKPKHHMQPTSCERMFMASNIKNGDIVSKFDFSKVTSASMVFASTLFESLPIIDLSSLTRLYYTFQASYYLKTIEKVILNPNVTSFEMAFASLDVLENITFEGVIGKSVNFRWSSLLSYVSVQNIIDCLADLTGQTSQTITFHAEVEARMTEEQKATITSKNWTLAVAS